MRSEPLRPVSSQERHELLDVLRGFALFGVLAVNLMQVAADPAVVPPERLRGLASAPLDRLVQGLVVGVFYNKFISIFALLFGVGFAIQSARATARDHTITPFYLRRLAWLFVIGAVHLTLAWWGDILHLYAWTGCLLLLASRWLSERALLGLGLALAVLSFVALRALPGIYELFGSDNWVSRTERYAELFATAAQRMQIMTSASYTGIVQENLEIFVYRFDAWSTLALTSFSLGFFLIGYVIGRRGYLFEVTRYRDGWRRVLTWGLAVGVPANSFLAVMGLLLTIPRSSPWFLLVQLVIYTGIVALTAAYVAAVALACESPRWRRRLRHLAPVGRMALSNYLGQTLFYLLLFYGLGLGLFGRIGVAAAVALAIPIFALQMAASRWWLGRWRFGPAEWLWRSLTYGKSQPMRAARENP